MPVPVVRKVSFDLNGDSLLRVNAPLVETWLVHFLRDECLRRRKIDRAVVGVSGGVDSALAVALCARAFGPQNVFGLRMPYRLSSQTSLDDAQLVIDTFGIKSETIEITSMVDGYVAGEQGASPARIGNVCARCRTTILFDQSAKLGALPIGTGNKTERLFGYFTWHADDAPPINPLGDLLKTQVFQLARHMGVPESVVQKPPTADLVPGQTDEGDFGVSFATADRILYFLVQGYPATKLVELGFRESDVDLVYGKVNATHWKRRPPTVAMISSTAIGESYLRPVDY